MENTENIVEGTTEDTVNRPLTELDTGIYETIGEKSDNKQASWNLLGDNAIVSFPSGKQIHFNIHKMDTRVMKFYGAKQWISDQVSAVKGESDKIVGMIDAYRDAVTSGLQLSANGRVQIIGKTRSNASGNAQAKAFENNVKATTKVISLEGLVMKKAMQGNPGVAEFTPEDQEKLNELMLVAVNAMKGQ